MHFLLPLEHLRQISQSIVQTNSLLFPKSPVALVRNELSWTAASGNNSAVGMAAFLAAAKHKPKFKHNSVVKPLSPCKHCKGNHCNNLCPNKQVSSGPSASLAASAWQDADALAGSVMPVQAALIDSVANHYMWLPTAVPETQVHPCLGCGGGGGLVQPLQLALDQVLFCLTVGPQPL